MKIVPIFSKHIVAALISFSFSNHLLYGMEAQSLVVEKHNKCGVKSLAKEVKSVLETNPNAAFIIEMDGVITNRTDPKSGKSIQSRGDMVGYVEFLSQRYPLAISCTERDFKVSVDLLRELGLEKSCCLTGEIVTEPQKFLGQSVCEIATLGRAACVRRTSLKRGAENDLTKYKQSAFSLQTTSAPTTNCDVVIFVGNSNLDIDLVLGDIEEISLRAHLKILHIFKFTEIDGQTWESDVVDRKSLVIKSPNQALRGQASYQHPQKRQDSEATPFLAKSSWEDKSQDSCCNLL